MTLEDYEALALEKSPKCRKCGEELCGIEHYPHDGGWPVDGISGLQWLYIECDKCEYQWALWKLGIPRVTVVAA